MPLAPHIDSLEYADNHGRAIYASCKRCKATVMLDLVWLAKRFGWKARLTDLEPKLYCRKCGARGGTLSTMKPERRCPTCQRPL